MIRQITRKTAAVIVALFMLLSLLVTAPIGIVSYSPANAASVNYPHVLLRISTPDNSRNINISGYNDKDACVASELKNSFNEDWRFDYVGTNSVGSYYKITNMGTGRLLTPMNYSTDANTSCVIFGNENKTSQHWYVIPVSTDSRGNALHYKIVNYDNQDMALTNGSNKITLSSYSGSSSQKWLLNPVGLQGFGGYCKEMNGNEKAAVIGGTLGKIVEVGTFDELKAACTSTETCTIVITKDISAKTSGYEKVLSYDNNYRYVCRDNYIYLAPNKTIIGSYGGNTLTNVYFRTYEGAAYGAGNNIIIRNINLKHDKELNYDNIWEFSYGWNFWIDHVTFEGHSGINTASLGSPDFDKFLNFKGTTDYLTISDCKFGLHEYAILLGYPTDDEETYQTYNGQPCVTLATNYYDNCVTRAPGLCRYGYFHSLNNFVDTFSMAYTVHSACKIYAENCYYQDGGNVICDWNEVIYPGSYAEDGSKFVNCKRTTIEGSAQVCTWRPTSNYSYVSKTADEAKAYCTTYSGSQSSATSYIYVANSNAYPSAGYMVAPDTGMIQEPVNGELIRELTPETSAAWKIKQNVQVGDTVFTDRDVTYTAIPEILRGAELIITDCDGKLVEGNQASFTAGKDMTVYAALDSRVETVPAWLESWQKTAMLVQNSSNVVFDIYSKCVREGEKIALGTNGQSSNCVNYTVMAAEHKGDINKDSKFNVADLVTMQNYMKRSAAPADWNFGDMNNDDILDVFDMVLMRKLLVNDFYTVQDIEKPVVTTTTATTTPVIATTTTAKPVETNSYEPEGFSFSGEVFLVGDSTVCEYDSNTSTTYNRYGWGMKLADQFNNVNVTNLALSGRSSRSFLSEQNYQTLKNSIGAGDYLFIQFGHNDEKTDEATYPGLGTFPDLDWSTLDNTGKNSSGQYSYDYILAAYYINLAKNKGAVPVLVTPITRRASDGTANYQQHTPYQEAMKRLGQNYGVAVIDMTALTTKLYTNLYDYGGAEETAKIHCYSDAENTTIDNTHLSNAGAQKIADMIAEQTKELGLTIGNLLK